MASLHILPSVLIGLYIIIETIANLAVGADILDLLLRVYAPDANALCPLKGIQTNRAEGSQAGFVYAVVIKSTHIDFLHIGILMGNVKPPAEKSSTGGLKSTVFLLFVLDTPEVGTFRRRICTAPLASQPPRLLSDRAANYGSIIVWKYRKAASSIFKVHGTVSGLSAPVRGAALAVTIVYLKTKVLVRNQ
jgi:hypothetical protein